MSGFCFRRLSFVLMIAILVWASSTGTCHARRGKHWKQNRAASASLSKKKGKSHGSGSHHHGGSKSKPKPPSSPKQSPPPPLENKGSDTFNVLDFGAKGDGDTDDTKVISQLVFIHILFAFSRQTLLPHYNAALQFLYFFSFDLDDITLCSLFHLQWRPHSIGVHNLGLPWTGNLENYLLFHFVLIHNCISQRLDRSMSKLLHVNILSLPWCSAKEFPVFFSISLRLWIKAVYPQTATCNMTFCLWLLEYKSFSHFHREKKRKEKGNCCTGKCQGNISNMRQAKFEMAPVHWFSLGGLVWIPTIIVHTKLPTTSNRECECSYCDYHYSKQSLWCDVGLRSRMDLRL